jgi:Icc-related predicted phosphoesterase
MAEWFFASDLHGSVDRYRKLFAAIEDGRPDVVLLGGDLLPSGMNQFSHDSDHEGGFVDGFLFPEFTRLKNQLGERYPLIGLILGNDDPRTEEESIQRGDSDGLWHYLHMRSITKSSFTILGYACIPPSPFLLKDWERYDVSRHVDAGCVSPEDGWRTVETRQNEIRYGTIKKDLEELSTGHSFDKVVFVFHVPPYQTKLDRAALDGKMVDHVPLDVHIGSIAVKRLIESHQPLITLHGHVHESARLTQSWSDRVGATWMFSAAHDGPELALVRFNPEKPDEASRDLV